VAYADFVTAMMAFFMLMWLLGATTEKQRKGIADYFNPTIPVVKASGGGSGAFGGDSVFSSNSLSQNGTGAAMLTPTSERQARGSTGTDSSDAASESTGRAQRKEDIAVVQQALMGIGGESMLRELMRRHIVTRLSDEGLVIEMFDTENARLFDDHNKPTRLLSDLVAAIVPVLDLVENDVAVQAHTRSVPLVMRENPIWDVTATRADGLRTVLEASLLPTERIERVTGFADRELLTGNPMDPRNDRVEIVVLRNTP
jgi:chemotaxis protein MotB